MLTSTFERGRFYIGPNGFPRFAGSASGVYLADTVRTDLSSPRGENLPERPANQVDLNSDSGIEEAFINRNVDEARLEETAFYHLYLLKSTDLLPAQELKARLNGYFARWHPLFPFLDGAHILQCFSDAVALAQYESILAGTGTSNLPSTPKGAFDGLQPEESLVMSAIFMVIFAIGSSDPAEQSSNVPMIRSISQATMLSHLIVGACQNSTINDFFAIQGLIAIELYFFVTRAFRPAMHLSGTLTKLAYESGLHRCPERFPNTFNDVGNRDLRKRVFYSLYVLDRLLSAEFGVPIMLNDSDIDTCTPGAIERHVSSPSPQQHSGTAASVVSAQTEQLDFESTSRSRKRKASPTERERDQSPSASAHESLSGRSNIGQSKGPRESPGSSLRAQSRLLPAYSLIQMARMIGQAMEHFNKSVPHRSVDGQQVLELRHDLDAWWNHIGLDCEDDVAGNDSRRQYSTLFTCLYHQQIINLCRPALSLPSSQIQHAQALQEAIASARKICSALARNLSDQGSETQPLLWSGYVEMVFFASLILVYGVRKDKRDPGLTNSLLKDLKRALKILDYYTGRFRKIERFGNVIKSLIERLDPLADSLASRENFLSTEPRLSSQNAQPVESHNAANNEEGFHFDFTEFMLDPDQSWAYHASVPPSPVHQTE